MSQIKEPLVPKQRKGSQTGASFKVHKRSVKAARTLFYDARRRLMAQEDLDPVISWLTSDASRSVTGSVVTVDDGQSI